MRPITPLRTCAMYILFVIGIVAFFILPSDDSPTWTGDLLASKAIAAASIYLLSRLVRKKDRRDTSDIIA